jgi:uncharacterized damage-inducible protein DinB
MTDQMTKARLIEELQNARQEWVTLLDEIPSERMTEAGATGYWSVKDVISHLTSYARWYMNAAEAQLRGEPPPMDGTEQMPFEERNQIYYEQTKDLPLEQVLLASAEVYQRLLNAVEKLPESFLIEPQKIPGTTLEFTIWQQLRGDVYDHTRTHIGWLRDWLESTSE